METTFRTPGAADSNAQENNVWQHPTIETVLAATVVGKTKRFLPV
jgi:hypothetical protein